MRGRASCGTAAAARLAPGWRRTKHGTLPPCHATAASTAAARSRHLHNQVCTTQQVHRCAGEMWLKAVPPPRYATVALRGCWYGPS